LFYAFLHLSPQTKKLLTFFVQNTTINLKFNPARFLARLWIVGLFGDVSATARQKFCFDWTMAVLILWFLLF
ncbi:MAG: hypothetical protein II573_03780, partial [Ruminococcus sp.]|nr:hypothetical protein [Ruminococcus sp.]